MIDNFKIPLTYWHDSLPAYNTDLGIDTLLDNLRQVFKEGYYPLIIPFPESQNTVLAPGATYTGSIRPPRGSLLISLNATSVTATSNQAHLSVRVYDNATKGDLYSNKYGKTHVVADDMSVNVFMDDPNNNNPYGFLQMIGPSFIQGPLTVLDDNGWQISVVNLDVTATANIVQVAFAFAVPKPVGTTIDPFVEPNKDKVSNDNALSLIAGVM